MKKRLRHLLVPLFWLGVWTAAALLTDRSVGGRGNELLLPYPGTVLRCLLALAGEGAFWRSILATLGRILAGLALGTLAGGLLGALTCAFPWADALFSPAVRVIRAAPVVSFILLVLLWTDRTFVPAIIAALMVLPVQWSGTVQGIRAADPRLLEAARAFRLGPWRTLRLAVLPALLPSFRASSASALGLAWKAGVAAEVLCLPETGIGQAIWRSRQTLETPALFAWTISAVALSLLLEKLLRRLLRERTPRREGAGT